MISYMLEIYKLIILRFNARLGGEVMQIVRLSVGDRIQMKKKHPCSADVFIVMRAGSDVRIKCTGCGRDMTFPREALEKMIKKVLSSEEED